MSLFEQIIDAILAAITSGKLKEHGVTGPTMNVQQPLGSFHKEPDPPAVQESRDLDHCEPELKSRFLALKADFEAKTGRQLFLTCTYRSPAKQAELYQRGRRGIAGEGKVTNCDGVKIKSRHNFFPSQAVDVCVDTDPGPGKVIVWDKAAYAPLGPLSKVHGLKWGGDWNGNGRSDDENFLDCPHLELPGAAMWGG